MLRFQVIDDLLPEGRAKEQLEQALHRADQAIAEGRSAVYDLRSAAVIPDDLAEGGAGAGYRAGDQGFGGLSNLVLEGEAKDLRPIVRDKLTASRSRPRQKCAARPRAQH